MALMIGTNATGYDVPMPTVELIDLQYMGQPYAIGAYLIRAPRGPVLIETGPGSCHDALILGVKACGVEPADIKTVFVTHIHLDHAGGAGWWAQHGATIHVHPFGAKHLIDPSKLLASAKRIYGDAMDTLFGDMLPAPADLVRPVEDGEIIDAAGLPIEVIETPGHARHHHAFATEVDGERICFTGDCAAMIGPVAGDSSPPILIPMPPPEFDLDAWQASIDRIGARNFDALYVTHIGRVDGVQEHLDRLKPFLKEHAQVIRRMLDEGIDEGEISRRYTKWMRDRAVADGLAVEDLDAFLTDNLTGMNVTGIVRYWKGVLAA